jgi:hypothetical protein
MRVEPRSVVIARGKIVNEKRENVLKTDIAKAILVEPAETGIKGVYSARIVSNVYGSSEIACPKSKKGGKNSSRILRDGEECRPNEENSGDRDVRNISGNGSTTREIREKLRNGMTLQNIDSSRKRYGAIVSSDKYNVDREVGREIKRQHDAGTFFSRAMQVTNVTKENAYCVIQLANTSSEAIKLQAGTVLANVEESFDEIEMEETKKTRRVLGMNKCPNQLGPEVKEQNVRVPEILREKLNHLDRDEKETMERVLLSRLWLASCSLRRYPHPSRYNLVPYFLNLVSPPSSHLTITYAGWLSR